MRKALYLLALLLVGLSALSARAENLGPGGGTRVIAGDQVFGPYRLYVTSSPEPAQVGLVTFAVRVSDAASGVKVRDAEVTVELVHSATGATVRGMATHADAGNEVDYAAHMALDQAGAWEGVIRVVGPAGAAEVTFLLRVAAPRQLSTLITIGLPFLVILGVLGGLWLARSGRQRPEKTLTDPEK